MKSLWLSVWARQQIKEKYQNGCHLKTTSQNHYLMCIYEGNRCTCVPNMKRLCLILWLGEVCTDDTNANTDAG